MRASKFSGFTLKAKYLKVKNVSEQKQFKGCMTSKDLKIIAIVYTEFI